MPDEHDNEISLKEYLNEKLARLDDKLARLDEQIESNRAQIAQQRVEDKNALEVRLLEHQGAHDREHSTAEKNAEKDEKKLDTRLLGMNEIREQLNNQAATFARLDYVDAKVTGLAEKLEQAISNLEGRREQAVTVLTARLDTVEKTLVSIAGNTGGARQTIAYIFAGLGAVATIVSLFIFFSGGR